MYDILEELNELSKSCIICSQREPKAWPSMLMEDEVSSNSLLKRVTKHCFVMTMHPGSSGSMAEGYMLGMKEMVYMSRAVALNRYNAR